VKNRPLILAIDQGTTNTKALLVDRIGAVVARTSRPLSISFPKPGWVEQDARAIWQSVRDCVAECAGSVPEADIAALGISNQRETVVAWDRRTGEPVGPCIVWQCRRTAPICDELRARGLEGLIRERSGQPVDPLFSATKAAWLLAAIEDGGAKAAAGDICIGTVDSWLLWKLTGGAVHATDPSNASRTQLLNLRSAVWDRELLDIFGIPPACLPEIHDSNHIFGETRRIDGLSDGIPVASLIGDSHAALFGHAAFAPGAVKGTYGTGSSLMTLTAEPAVSRCGLSSTIAWSLAGSVRHALEGNITSSGATVQWAGELLGLPNTTEDAAALASTVPDSGGVYLVPAFAGLGAPHWDADARGLLCGLTRGVTGAHIARAALESIAFQVGDVFEALRKDLGAELPTLLADGGASRNDELMQFQADILNRSVIRNQSADLSATGAAWLAGLAVGYWRSTEELGSLDRPSQRFDPRMPLARRRELLEGWRDALGRTRSAPRPAGVSELETGAVG
jgi:glycerol kinase